MDAFKSLTIGWSIVWAACLFAFSNMSVGQMSLPTLLGVGSEWPTVARQALFLIPLYAGGVWAIGCILIAALCLLVSKLTIRNK